MLFNVNGKDYTRRIISGSYGVNSYDQYKEWTDANYDTHRHVFRSQVTGSFLMYFGRESEYNAFLEDMRTVKNNDGSFTISVACNNTNDFRSNRKCYVEFNPVREQRVIGEAWYPQVQIKIEEV